MAWIARLCTTAMSHMYAPDMRHRQHGAMLVEVMTGLVIGLMVTLTALSSLAFMQASSLVQGEAFRLQQRADVALQVIGLQLRQAGAIELQAAQNGAQVSFSNAFNGHSGGGHAVHGEDGASGAPDTLFVSHQDGVDTRDCLGNQPDTAQTGIRVDSQFSIAAGALRCLGAHHGTGNQIIVDRLEDFQVRYGLRTDSALGPQFRYVKAAAVGSAWSEVLVVHVCLQIASERGLQARQTPEMLDCQGRAIRPDGYVRRIAQAAFSLRNGPL